MRPARLRVVDPVARAGVRVPSDCVLADTLNSGNSPHAVLAARARAHRPACMPSGARNPALPARSIALPQWQASRDWAGPTPISRHSRATREPIAFFQSDLYGSADFAQRDADLARVVPVMTRMLPGARHRDDRAGDGAQRAVARARPGAAAAPAARGRHVHRRRVLRRLSPMDDRPARDRQIDLIGEIGAGLDVYVRKPLIHSALVMMRQPGAAGRAFRAARFSRARVSRRSGRCTAPPSSWRRSTAASAS